MAFDNSVPYTIDGTIDTNTNLITFVVSKYDLNRATNKYDLLQWTETFAIPAGACGYKRNTNQVFIVENNSQDEFSIYQGWYDVQADVTYSSITVALDNMVDALVAQQTGGGGGTLFYQLTEAQAKTAITNQTLDAGATYQIILDGTSEGNSNDLIHLVSIGSDVFSQNVTYFHNSDSVFVVLTGIFNASGWAFKSADPTAEVVVGGKFDDSTDTLTISGYEAFGIWPIPITANEDLETITGGFEGMEITIYATGGGTFVLNVLGTGNIVGDNGGYALPTPIPIVDNNQSCVRLRKRGSNWLVIQSFV